MWILRFQNLSPKDYNKLQRVCKKYGFVPRKYSSMVYAKAILKYYTLGGSWRSIAKEFGLDHIVLYRFSSLVQEKKEFLDEIFHIFLNAGVARYIGEKRYVTRDELDNSTSIYDLTREQFMRIVHK